MISPNSGWLIDHSDFLLVLSRFDWKAKVKRKKKSKQNYGSTEKNKSIISRSEIFEINFLKRK